MLSFEKKIENHLHEQEILEEGLKDFVKKVGDYISNHFQSLWKSYNLKRDNFVQIEFNAGLGSKWGPHLNIKLAEDMKADGSPADSYMELGLHGFKIGPKLIKSEAKVEWIRGSQEIRNKIIRDIPVNPEPIDELLTKITDFIKVMPIWKKLKDKIANIGVDKEAAQASKKPEGPGNKKMKVRGNGDSWTPTE